MAKRLFLTFSVVLLLAAACGDDSSSESSPDPDPPTSSDETGSDVTESDDAGGDAESEADAGGDGPIDGCPAQGFVGQISRSADGDHVDAGFSGGAAAEVWTEGVVATRLAPAGQYTLYASDHEYEGDPRSFDTVTAAPGGTVATLSFGLQAGYTAGERVDLNADEGVVMVVIIDSGGGASVVTSGSSGQFTPIAWSDDWICFDFDYFDDLQSANGVISAPIVAGF